MLQSRRAGREAVRRHSGATAGQVHGSRSPQRRPGQILGSSSRIHNHRRAARRPGLESSLSWYKRRGGRKLLFQHDHRHAHRYFIGSFFPRRCQLLRQGIHLLRLCCLCGKRPGTEHSARAPSGPFWARYQRRHRRAGDAFAKCLEYSGRMISVFHPSGLGKLRGRGFIVERRARRHALEDRDEQCSCPQKESSPGEQFRRGSSAFWDRPGDINSLLGRELRGSTPSGFAHHRQRPWESPAGWHSAARAPQCWQTGRQ